MRRPTADASVVACVPSVHSLAAARVQLKLLESAIFKAEQELEASWAKACFSQSPVPYVDEEWGSPWAEVVAQTTAKLCGFQEARGRLLARMQELRLDDDKAPESDSDMEARQEPPPRNTAENALSVMKDLLAHHLAEQAELRSENHALMAQNSELRKKEAVWRERTQQQQNQLEHLEQLKAQMEQQLAELRAERSADLRAQMQSAQLRSAELQKENATLKERCFQKDWCMKKILEQLENVRGEAPEVCAGGTGDRPWEDDVSIVSDLSSWVCVASSQPCFFLADATFKTPSGQALQAWQLCKGSELLAADGHSVLEVLDHPQEVVANEVLELWAGDVILRVVPDHCIATPTGTKKAKELRPGDLVTVDGHPAALIQVETKSMSCPAPAIKVIMGPDNIPPLMVTRRLSEESPFGSSV